MIGLRGRSCPNKRAEDHEERGCRRPARSRIRMFAVSAASSLMEFSGKKARRTAPFQTNAWPGGETDQREDDDLHVAPLPNASVSGALTAGPRTSSAESPVIVDARGDPHRYRERMIDSETGGASPVDNAASPIVVQRDA